jgi:hypothetical protein
LPGALPTDRAIFDLRQGLLVCPPPFLRACTDDTIEADPVSELIAITGGLPRNLLACKWSGVLQTTP